MIIAKLLTEWQRVQRYGFMFYFAKPLPSFKIPMLQKMARKGT